MNKSVLILLALSMMLAVPAYSTYYQYTDKNGDVTFTDDLGSIPEDQRSKVKESKEQKRPTPTIRPKNFNTLDPRLGNQESKVAIALQKYNSALRKVLELRKSQPAEFVNQMEAALSELEKRSKEYKDDPDSKMMIKDLISGYISLGDFVRFNLHSPDKAVLFYRKSAEWSEKDPGSMLTDIRLADTYQFDLKDKGNAIKYYRRALADLSAFPGKKREEDDLFTAWWKKWLEHEIQYLTTGKPFSGAIDREALGTFPSAVMIFMANFYGGGMVEFDTEDPMIKGPMTDTLDPKLDRNTLSQNLKKLPLSHFTLGATTYALSYLPTPESILTYLESQDPARYWSTSILCSAVLYKVAGSPELLKARSFLFPGASTAPFDAGSPLQVAADQFQKRSGVHCAVEPDKRFDSPEKTWEYLMTSLKQGNVEAALSCLTPPLKGKFKGLFSKMSSSEMNQMAKSFSGFEKTKDLGGMNEYVVLRHAGGRDMGGFIYFINSFGEWKIDEM
jgi:hypothetical protein